MSELNGTQPAFDDCTIDTCSIDRSFYPYRIALVPNAVLAGLFAASLAGFLAAYVLTRRGGVFALTMGLGVALELAGYVGRVLSYHDQWARAGFLLQATCLTFAPAFLSAGIYLCLGRVVDVFGAYNSRIPPGWYTRIFIPCDAICILAQAVGGTMSAVAASQRRSTALGDDIVVFGLGLQVMTLLAFLLLAADFGLQTYLLRLRLQSTLPSFPPPAFSFGGAEEEAKSSGFGGGGGNPDRRDSPAFRAFLAALAVSALAVFARCAYRVAAYAGGGGFGGGLAARQTLFVALDGAMVALAALALNVFHPAVCCDGLPTVSANGGSGSSSGGSDLFGEKKKNKKAGSFRSDRSFVSAGLNNSWLTHHPMQNPQQTVSYPVPGAGLLPLHQQTGGVNYNTFASTYVSFGQPGPDDDEDSSPVRVQFREVNWGSKE
ncbi:RTA1 like protein-domain-containing protein [Xylariaceae sp. FL0804]|nr:RTA1 like protein-domain-containing protein [Xylariaceae sp. FL0804]